MMSMVTKTLVLSLTALGLTAALAWAQPDSTTVRTYSSDRMETAYRADTNTTTGLDREDPAWHQAWHYVGSGGSNLGLQSGRNPYAEPLPPWGDNHSGADRSGYGWSR